MQKIVRLSSFFLIFFVVYNFPIYADGMNKPKKKNGKRSVASKSKVRKTTLVHKIADSNAPIAGKYLINPHFKGSYTAHSTQVIDPTPNPGVVTAGSKNLHITNKETVLIAPMCHDSRTVIISTYGPDKFVSQIVRLDSGKFVVKSNGSWSENFKNPKDQQLARDLLQKLLPTEIDIYPEAVAVVKPQWQRSELNAFIEIIKTHFGDDKQLNMIPWECPTIPENAVATVDPN